MSLFEFVHDEVYILTMPRKCCTVFDGKSCRANYDETKNKSHEKVTVYGFPRPPEEERWVRSLPNILSCKISKYIGVCAKHWPPNVPKVKVPGGAYRPTETPSIFGQTKQLLFSQSLTSPERYVEEREVTAESRALKVKTRHDEVDRLGSWSNVVNYCLKFFL